MLYPFLTVFSRGLGVELPAVSLALTARSLTGTLGPFLASVSDSRGRKTGMLLGLGLFTAGTGLVAIWPTYPAFILSLILSTLGNYVFLPALQAYLGDRIPYAQRGRTLAITELSWSLSFILGIPFMGLLISRLNWTAPFIFLAILGALALALMAWLLPADPAPENGRPTLWRNFRTVLASPAARAGLAMSMMMTAANESVNLVFGVWLENSYGLKIAALGAASAVIGLSELGGEGLTALLVDRLGKERSIRLGLALNILAALLLPWLGRSVWGALAGLFLFYISSEITIVSALPLISAVLPHARASLLATNVAFFSLGRALGAVLAPFLFQWGILANVAATILFNLAAALILRRVEVQE